MSTSNYGVPIIDSFATARILAPTIMNNVVQKIQLSNGKGVTEQFSQNTFTDEIRIVRQKALVQQARTLGSATDGAHLSAQSIEQPESAHYGMRIRQIWNTPITIPQTMMDMIPLDLLDSNEKRISEAVAKNINASTMAEQLAKALNYEYNDGITPVQDHIVKVTLGTDDVLDKIFDMGAILDEGDADNDVDTFPKTSRVLQIRPSVKRYLMQSGKAVFDVGNWKGQDMLKVGAIEPEVIPNTNVDGYQGQLDQTDVFLTAPAIFTLAESYLGLNAGDLQYVYGIMSSAEGTGRAIAFTNSVQVIPEPLGQGVRLLPLYRWGHETWFEKSIVLLVDNTNFASLGTGSLTSTAPGSRA